MFSGENFSQYNWRKKIIALSLAAVVFLVVSSFFYWMISKALRPPLGIDSTRMEDMSKFESHKQKFQEMMNAVEKANEDAPAVSQEEQAVKSKEMGDALEKENANDNEVKAGTNKADKSAEATLKALNDINK
jgi:hypothetical protein